MQSAFGEKLARLHIGSSEIEQDFKRVVDLTVIQWNGVKRAYQFLVESPDPEAFERFYRAVRTIASGGAQ